MFWMVLAFSGALCDALKNVWSKRSLSHIDGYILGFAIACVTFILMLPGVGFLNIPDLANVRFWLALLLTAGLESLGIILYLAAMQHAELSLTIPMLSFTPIFLLLTAPFLVGDYPSRYDILGVLLIVVGTYLIYVRDAIHGWFAPLQALAHAKGPRRMLLAALIYNFISEADKIGIRQSSPLFWLLARQGMTALFLLVIMVCKSRKKMRQIPRHWNDLLVVGGFQGLALGCCMAAFQLAPVFNVIAIKRTSIVLSVALSHIMLKESQMTARLTGATVMLCGVCWITLH